MPGRPTTRPPRLSSWEHEQARYCASNFFQGADVRFRKDLRQVSEPDRWPGRGAHGAGRHRAGRARSRPVAVLAAIVITAGGGTAVYEATAGASPASSAATAVGHTLSCVSKAGVRYATSPGLTTCPSGMSASYAAWP